jgi:hypothetical protein
VVQIATKGSIERIMGLLYMLQLAKALSMYEVKYPTNAEIMLQEVRKLVDFEALKPDNVLAQVAPGFNLQTLVTHGDPYLKEDEVLIEESAETFSVEAANAKAEEGQLSGNLESSGVSSPNIMLQLSAVLLVLGVFLAAILTALAILFFCRCCGGVREKIRAKLQKTKESFMWNGTIRSISIAYLNLIIAATVQFLVIRQKPNEVTGAQVASAAGVLGFCLCYCLYCLYFLVKNRDVLAD